MLICLDLISRVDVHIILGQRLLERIEVEESLLLHSLVLCQRMVVNLTLFALLHFQHDHMLPLEILQLLRVLDAQIQLLHFQQLLNLGLPLVYLVVFVELFANDYVLIQIFTIRFHKLWFYF